MSELPASNVDVEVEVEEDQDQDIKDVEESGTDNVGDPSVEINVEELISEIEKETAGASDGDAAARRRLDEIMERKRIEKEISDYDDL